ncbi:hypothetical protein DRW07_16050 [Alteromonas sediminis]|uniref:3-hydroxylacyl-ACP dehydratase n=1 Tax=Alteromonas sediminis TaxID=2259342 RepID=A0A3N5Z576_9ALTE|nr:hypothetical protein [Alteromonas sediminis]RPJ65414.1 hypothetical protein DRW07_16050 [Alteromonas sediminis]
MDSRFESKILDLIPHRPPMLLINRILALDVSESSALVIIDEQTPFFEEGKGVPAWLGLEYMGQTAAMIAGHRLELGLIEPHLGFLIGTRAYKATCDYFEPGCSLQVTSRESAMVADGFAKFDCEIAVYDSALKNQDTIATASLSVFRRPLNEENS